ncbi:MAG TPA: hypothetical protein PLP66_07735 [Phycisphaerae bacterium]|nr:hypothetical protein [Phycisphaerae bacterium]
MARSQSNYPASPPPTTISTCSCSGVVLHGAQPEQLQVEIVVGGGLAGFEVGIEGNAARLALALEGHAQRAADVLAEPAGEDAIAKLTLVEQHLGLVRRPGCADQQRAHEADPAVTKPTCHMRPAWFRLTT